jgi:lipoyl(octanoyl) transferase
VEGVIRLLPYAEADGATNMAADEALVRSAAEGVASLRFYGWTAATLSLGYFQPCAVRLTNSRLASLPWVRRPSGGATLVHHHELTYAIALPSGWQTDQPWMLRMHRIITAALADLGLGGKIDAACGDPIRRGDILCFQQHTAGDLLSVGNKIVGSAQRKFRQALMQHGSILLRQSEFTPELPGLHEITGLKISRADLQAAVTWRFLEDTKISTLTCDWTTEEASWIDRLVIDRYATTAWNQRR